MVLLLRDFIIMKASFLQEDITALIVHVPSNHFKAHKAKIPRTKGRNGQIYRVGDLNTVFYNW